MNPIMELIDDEILRVNEAESLGVAWYRYESVLKCLREAVMALDWYDDACQPESQYVKAGLHLRAHRALQSIATELGVEK